MSVLIYDQVCATEKRRRRKRGRMPDPPRRVFINTLVCEGCGDCGKKSFCVSVLPKDTEYGRKREIDQSNCNKDYRCVEGFCPSFVTVHGGRPRKGDKAATAARLASLPPPVFASDLSQPWNILITGVGGTGVVTIGALLGMAAISRAGLAVLDQPAGAEGQRGDHPHHIARRRRHPRGAHRRRRGRPLNTWEAMPGTFTTARTWVPGRRHHQAVRRLGGESPATDRRHRARHRADGRRDRHQPVHARLCLAARAGAAVADADARG